MASGCRFFSRHALPGHLQSFTARPVFAINNSDWPRHTRSITRASSASGGSCSSVAPRSSGPERLARKREHAQHRCASAVVAGVPREGICAWTLGLGSTAFSLCCGFAVAFCSGRSLDRFFQNWLQFATSRPASRSLRNVSTLSIKHRKAQLSSLARHLGGHRSPGCRHADPHGHNPPDPLVGFRFCRDRPLRRSGFSIF